MKSPRGFQEGSLKWWRYVLGRLTWCVVVLSSEMRSQESSRETAGISWPWKRENKLALTGCLPLSMLTDQPKIEKLDINKNFLHLQVSFNQSWGLKSLNCLWYTLRKEIYYLLKIFYQNIFFWILTQSLKGSPMLSLPASCQNCFQAMPDRWLCIKQFKDCSEIYTKMPLQCEEHDNHRKI